MTKQKSCGMCAYTRVYLENFILEQAAEKEKMNELKKDHLANKAHYKMRAAQKILNEITYAERKLKSSSKIA